jgi:hypothetical protein
MPSRQKLPSLKKHLTTLFRQEFATLNWKKVRRDLLLGIFIVFVANLFGVTSDLSIKEDWQQHPISLMIFGLLPAWSVLALDVFFRAYKALRRCYKERKHFEVMILANTSLFALTWLLFVACLGSFIFYTSYRHFVVWFGDIGDNETTPPKYHLYIGQALHKPVPNTAVCFQKITIENFGPPVIITSWSLIVTLPDKQQLRGAVVYGGSKWPDRSNPQGQAVYMPSDNLFAETNNRPIIKGQPVSGFAEFFISGVRQEVVGMIGTDLEIVFWDDMGHWHTAHHRVPAEGWTFRPPE